MTQEFELRGSLAARLKCWHRLTDEESTELVGLFAALQPTWKPIALAPKDGTEVIVGVDVASVWIARNARFVRSEEWMHREPEDTDGWWAYKNSVSQEQLEGIYEPTHFLPMPDPS